MSPDGIDVLYVDDEPSLLELGKTFLEKEESQLNVETTPRPEKALEMLNENDYDAVISDYQMPSMDGLDLLETIRKERGNDIPFIMFTGKGREEVAMDALNLGANRYLRKGSEAKTQYGMLAQAVIDETEHIEVEKKLSEKQDQFRSIFDSVPVGIAIHELIQEDGEPVNYRIVDTNPAFEKETGIPRQEVQEELATDAYGLEEPPFLDRYAQVAETGEPEMFRDFFEPLDRKFHITAFTHQEGTFTTAFVDITEQEARKERRKMFQEAVEHAGHAIYLTDQDGTIEYVNPAFEELTGFSADEAIGENARILRSGEQDEEYYEELWSTIASGETWQEEITNQRSDGELYTTEQTIAPLPGEEEVTGYVAIQKETDR